MQHHHLIEPLRLERKKHRLLIQMSPDKVVRLRRTVDPKHYLMNRLPVAVVLTDCCWKTASQYRLLLVYRRHLVVITLYLNCWYRFAAHQFFLCWLPTVLRPDLIGWYRLPIVHLQQHIVMLQKHFPYSYLVEAFQSKLAAGLLVVHKQDYLWLHYTGPLNSELRYCYHQ